MSKLLVKFSANWADEMDIDGFKVTTRDKWNRHIGVAARFFKSHPNGIELSCGSNEEVTFQDLKEYRAAFHTKVITEEEAVTMKRLFPVAFREGYGHFLTIEDAY